MNTTDQFGADPQIYVQESALPIFIHTLPADKYFQELKDAAELVKQCSITSDGNEGSGGYFQCRLKDYLTAVERFVENTFAALQTDSQPYNGEYLSDVMSLICSKVAALVPVLEDSELVSYLLDSYNRHLFCTLHLLMDGSSSVKDAFYLLQWVTKLYFG